MTEESAQIASSERMVRNAQDLFGALYHQNQIFQRNAQWIEMDSTEQQNILYELWVSSSSDAKIAWIKTAQKYLEYHYPDYEFAKAARG